MEIGTELKAVVSLQTLPHFGKRFFERSFRPGGSQATHPQVQPHSARTQADTCRGRASEESFSGAFSPSALSSSSSRSSWRSEAIFSSVRDCGKGRERQQKGWAEAALTFLRVRRCFGAGFAPRSPKSGKLARQNTHKPHKAWKKVPIYCPEGHEPARSALKFPA